MFSISVQVYISIIQGTIHCYYGKQSETEEKSLKTIHDFWTGNFTLEETDNFMFQA